MKDLDYGKDYRYAHDEAGGFARPAKLPADGMADLGFTGRWNAGLEIRIAESCVNSRPEQSATRPF